MGGDRVMFRMGNMRSLAASQNPSFHHRIPLITGSPYVPEEMTW